MKIFIQLIFFFFKVFVQDFEQYSYSLAMYIPEYDKSKIDLKKSNFFPSNTVNIPETGDKLNKIFCRIVFRASVSSLRSDFNGLDLYTVLSFVLKFLKL